MPEFIKNLLRTNPTRVIAYSSGLVVAAVLQGAAYLGVEVPGEVATAIGVVATFLAAELIRRIVYAPATVEALKADATASV